MRSSFACLLLLPAVVFACGSDEEKKGGTTSGASCVPKAAECYVAGADGPGSECLAKHDNTGQTTWTGRFSQITVIKPAKLSNEFVQVSVIDQGISLNQPQCFEGGDGTFAWIFSLDSTTNRMKTGGGLPITDPAAGTCFVTIPGAALPIAPIEVDVTVSGNSFSASGIDVNVPIFLPGQGTDNPTILPLHDVEFEASFADENRNCIGKHNGATLSSLNSCQPDTKATPPERGWTPGGTIKGFITITEADQVYVEQLGSTLCVFLAGLEWSGTEKSCETSEKWIAGERPEGDWCEATNAAADGTCKDAFRLEGEFAASAFKVNGDCP
jgi:hypothetical protein